jgi:hypothetical protein
MTEGDDKAAALLDAVDAAEAEAQEKEVAAGHIRAAVMADEPIFWRGQEIKPAGFERRSWALRMGMLDVLQQEDDMAALAQRDVFGSVELLWIYLGPFEEVRSSVFVRDPARPRMYVLDYSVFQDAAHAWRRREGLEMRDIIEGLQAVAQVEARAIASEFDIIADLNGPPSGNALGPS